MTYFGPRSQRIRSSQTGTLQFTIMCGITGIFSLGDRAVPDRLETMNATLVHRGPDDAGTFRDARAGLAMRRLSIIGVDNGHQPITNEDRDLVLVFNGEIYNYVELKRRLEGEEHRFSSSSDAEVVVHLYEQYGDRFVDHLRGMFGLALYDRRQGRLILVRDRSGQKPLYYAIANGLLIFASEIKAIHASGLITKELNTDALASYLTYGFVVGTSTLFRGVHKLPAGHMLTATATAPATSGRVTSGSVRIQPYWDLPTSTGATLSLDQAAATVLELLSASVEKRMMSEVPLGAFLSGGVDSSAVVALMKRHLDHLQTFCVGFEDSRFDELPHARAVAQQFGTEHHELVLRGINLELLRDLNWHHDEPAGDPAAVPTYCLSHFARQRITVVMTGEGGDETFAGYPHHRHAAKLGRLIPRLPGLGVLAGGVSRLEGRLGAVGSARFWKGAWIAGLPADERHRAWVAAYTDAELSRLLSADLRPTLDNGSLAAPFRALYGNVSHRELLDQLLYIDAKVSLADQLLMKVDKTTMAASLEARCPLLDQELLEYAAALPSSLKLSAAGGTKIVLRHALRGLLTDEILDRPKQGFDVPLESWLLRDLAGPVQAGLLDDGAPIAAYLDPAIVRDTWARFRQRRDMRSCKQIWRLLNLAVWHEIHWPSGRLGDLGEPGSRRNGKDPAADLFVERRAS